MSYWRRNSIVLKGRYIIDINVPVTFLCVKGNHSWRWLSELLTTKMMGNKMGNTETSDGHKNSQILLFAEWSLTTNRFKVMHFQCLYFCLYWTWIQLKPQLKHCMWQKKRKKCHWRGTQICKAGTLNVFYEQQPSVVWNCLLIITNSQRNYRLTWQVFSALQRHLSIFSTLFWFLWPSHRSRNTAAFT